MKSIIVVVKKMTYRTFEMGFGMVDIIGVVEKESSNAEACFNLDNRKERNLALTYSFQAFHSFSDFSLLLLIICQSPKSLRHCFHCFRLPSPAAAGKLFHIPFKYKLGIFLLSRSTRLAALKLIGERFDLVC